MKKQLITLFALAAIPTLSLAQTADEILDKHVAALGGADKVAGLKTMDLEQTMSVMGMDMTSKSTYIVGKSVRNDISVMGQQITNVVNGDSGWMINPMAGGSTAQDLPADAVKMAKSTTEPQALQLAYLKTDKVPYELVGKEKYGDKDAFNLKVTRPEGVYNYYVDAANYQLLGYKANVSMGGQSGETTAKFSNYKSVDGINLPYTSEVTSPMVPGGASITATTTKVTLNSTVDPSVFAKPK